MDTEEPKRFWSKIDVGDPDECWEWLTQKNNFGYGRFRIHDKPWLAHRVAWVLTYGAIPDGLFVIHRCDNPSCCNPYHLLLGTQTDNMADAARKGRMRTKRGDRDAKLTRDDVLDIRELYASGEWTQQELADEFGVNQPNISHIVRGRRWGWLEDNK